MASVVFTKVNTWEVNDGGNRVTVYGGGKMFDCEEVRCQESWTEMKN